jgi:addiction module RelE/StbE family toxin
VVQKIKWTNQAKSDLYDIYRFIARDSTRYAQIQIENIQNAVSNLAIFPLMGRNVPEFPHLPYREILVGNYRVLYRFEEEKGQVIMMSVVHGRRLLKEPPD